MKSRANEKQLFIRGNILSLKIRIISHQYLVGVFFSEFDHS